MRSRLGFSTFSTFTKGCGNEASQTRESRHIQLNHSQQLEKADKSKHGQYVHKGEGTSDTATDEQIYLAGERRGEGSRSLILLSIDFFFD